MPLRIKCPTGHTLIVPDDRAGRTLCCPRCGQSVIVPGEANAVASDALPSVPHANAVAERSQLSAVTATEIGANGQRSSDTIGTPRRRSSDPVRPQRSDGQFAKSVVKPKSRVLPPVTEPATCEKPAELESNLAVALPEPAIAPPIHDEPFIPPIHEVPAPPPFVVQAIEPVTVSLHADAASTLAVYQLALALVAASVFSVVPAVWDLVEYLQIAESQFVARWALAIFFLGIVQLAYAVYVFQLPDWTTVWVVTLLLLVVAAIYAAVLGLVLLSPADGFLVGEHGLQLADKLAGGKAALWCLCMVSLLAILAFFAGRLSARWHKTEMLLRACS